MMHCESEVLSAHILLAYEGTLRLSRELVDMSSLDVIRNTEYMTK